MYSLASRLASSGDAQAGAAWQWACMLRSAIPGIVKSFDSDKQTCVVQPAIQENVVIPPNASATSVAIDPLEDVPIIMPRAGGWAMTFPIQAGDECLLVFGDMCIDGWWQSGGVQPQFDRRRHDLSDAFALFGPWSQPRRLSGYSTDSVQIRNEDGSVKIDVASGQVTVTAPSVITANGGTVQPVVTKDLYTWVNETLLPTLAAPPHNIVVTPPPLTSITTVLQAE